MGANMQKMMKQMQQMQNKMNKLQEELAQTPVEATAGGGVVKVVVNGANEVLSVEINPEAAVAGLMDIFKGEKPQLSQQDFMEVMKEFQKEMRAAAEKAQQQISDNNKKQEVEFMTVNRKNEGVKETASGLQYKVITEGTGAKPSK